MATMESTISTRRRTLTCAIICVAFAAIPTASNSQISTTKADVRSLCDLVSKMQVIGLRYYYDPITAEPRELYPYAVGYTRSGNVLLFGRQVKGYSKSAESGEAVLPSWRNFRVDKIKMKEVMALNSTFEPVRPNADEYREIVEFACKHVSAYGT
jgi:hypothetical protein